MPDIFIVIETYRDDDYKRPETDNVYLTAYSDRKKASDAKKKLKLEYVNDSLDEDDLKKLPRWNEKAQELYDEYTEPEFIGGPKHEVNITKLVIDE